jgi:hypothetical protein
MLHRIGWSLERICLQPPACQLASRICRTGGDSIASAVLGAPHLLLVSIRDALAALIVYAARLPLKADPWRGAERCSLLRLSLL